jgi:hypothetical protein
MWHTRKYDSAMDSPLLAQPWTPPDVDVEASPRSDYFSDRFRPSPSFSSHIENEWARSPSRPDMPAQRHRRCDTPTDLYEHSRPKPVERLTDPAPHTPTRILDFGSGGGNVDGALRYPYTPDSSKILRRNTELPSSPPSWDQYSEHSSSPVQNALSSCLAHFEDLIHSQQPDEDQMEYIVGQFEVMTSFLAAEDSQTKKTDEHLFSETDGAGLGITGEDDAHTTDTEFIPKETHDAYAAEVGSYIEGVKKHIYDLKMRLDEVKMLNSIQLDVIEDLRGQMNMVRQGMRSSLSMKDEVKLAEEATEILAAPQGRKDSIAPEEEFGVDSWETLVDGDRAVEPVAVDEEHEEQNVEPTKDTSTPRYRKIVIVRKPEPRSFWASIGQALDSFGEALREE